MNALLAAIALTAILADHQDPGGDAGPFRSMVGYAKMGAVDFTFTPSTSGALTRIELLRISGSAGEITATVGDGLASSVLTVELHNPSEREPEWVGWVFDGAEVTQGEAYRLTLAKPDNPLFSWGFDYHLNPADPSAWRPAFRVWVEPPAWETATAYPVVAACFGEAVTAQAVPEPSAWIMAGIAFVCVVVALRLSAGDSLEDDGPWM